MRVQIFDPYRYSQNKYHQSLREFESGPPPLQTNALYSEPHSL